MRLIFALLFMSLLLIAGCGKNSVSKISKLTVASGSEQCLAPGGKMEKPLRIHVTGESAKNIFGKSSALPVAGARITARSPEGVKNKIAPVSVLSDAGGIAEFHLTFPDDTGEQTIEIYPEGAEDKKLTARFFSGIEISGSGEEYFTNSTS